MKCITALTLASTLLAFSGHAAPSDHPTSNSSSKQTTNSTLSQAERVKSPNMLSGKWVPENHHRTDFDNLPKLPVSHAVISDVKAAGGVNQHNYLIHHDGLFWAMWSDGPKVEDHGGQVVKYSRSSDGLNWEEPKMLSPYPNGTTPDSPYYKTKNGKGWRYISRGFWVWEGELYALAGLDEAGTIFGPSLELHAFKWNEEKQDWIDNGVLLDNAINNFPPQRLPSGEWGMSRRKHDYKKNGAEFVVGGLKSMTDWTSIPVTVADSPLKAEEPVWWTLPDGKGLVALFRDNSSSGYLYRAYSENSGQTWTAPTKTDFPDATSKVFVMRLSDGRYALVSNPKPSKRNLMTIALSDDGIIFDRMYYLVGGRHVDYPHMIEHEGYLYIAHSGAKQSVEVERVKLEDFDKVAMPEQALEIAPLKVDGETLRVVTTGEWAVSSKAPEKFGESYLFMKPGGHGSATLSRNLPEAGKYEVFGWWNTKGKRHRSVPFIIQHADGESTVLVDQARQGGQWVSLGVFPFEKGTASVKIIADGYQGFVVAEAVRFVAK